MLFRLSACCRKCFPSGRKTGQKGPWLSQNGRRRCGTPRCWRCWQESLFFFQAGSVLYKSTSHGSCSSSTQEAATSGLRLILKSLEARGVQGQTFQVIWASWRQSTKQQYASYLTRWNKFCIQRQCDPLRPPVDMVLQFLTTLYEEGLEYSAINTARSALSAVVILPDNKTVGSHPSVVRFLKGIFELRTPQPRYNETWDVYKVLHYFKHLGENSELSLKDLTFKLYPLLLLIYAQRVQTVHLISLSDIHFHHDGCTIHITEELKQSRPGFHPQPLQLPYYAEDKTLCVVTCLREYIDRTAEFRSEGEGSDKLLLCY